MERRGRALVWYACLQLVLGRGASRPILGGHASHHTTAYAATQRDGDATAVVGRAECAASAHAGDACLDVAEPDVDPTSAPQTLFTSLLPTPAATRVAGLRRIVAPDDSLRRCLRSAVLLA